MDISPDQLVLREPGLRDATKKEIAIFYEAARLCKKIEEKEDFSKAQKKERKKETKKEKKRKERKEKKEKRKEKKRKEKKRKEKKRKEKKRKEKKRKEKKRKEMPRIKKIINKPDPQILEDLRVSLKKFPFKEQIIWPQRGERDIVAEFYAGPLLETEFRASKIYGDGDCLFSSASVALTGCDIWRAALRLGTYFELIENEAHYLQIIQGTKDYEVLCSDDNDGATLNLIEAGEFHTPFQREALRGIRLLEYSGFLQMWGLATVVGRPIRSLYPVADGVSHLTRTFFPRVPGRLNEVLRIQWTSLKFVIFYSFNLLLSIGLLSIILEN